LNNFVSISEIDTKLDNIKYASIQIRARVRGASGAVAGMFTYADDSNESDIEILTRDANTEVRCTNQPSVNSRGDVVPQAETDVTMKNSNWGQWNTYRLDWTSSSSAWYINGVNTVNKTYSIPTKPSSFILNMWSDGGVWSGPMPVGQSAYLDIGWIDMAYNTGSSSPKRIARRVKTSATTSSASSSSSCSAVCSVDNVFLTGQPTLMTAH
jgi:beta-glucanase (GH16 family)